MISRKKMEKGPAWRKLRAKLGSAAVTYRMINPGDRILVGVSGGCDSMIMLALLAALRRRAPIKFELLAATFDPGFPKFGLDRIRRFAKSLDVEFVSAGVDIPGLLAEKRADEHPCVLCSRLRRGVLYTLAEKHGCSKLALAQHLDDAAASLLMGMFRGHGLATMGPNVSADDHPVRVIRPLIFAEKSEIKAVAGELKMRFFERCPYAGTLKRSGDRAYFERLIAGLDKRIPNVRGLMLRSMSDLRPGHLLDPNFIFPEHPPER
ncbi:MAG: tRNA 2-thiocytidine biosynthesis TtcA family protein [Victivallaceae bacterium]|nr:ATP-binding protein [Victivallaceae bacterium]